jgi:uncharacterized membrane protein
MLAVFFFLFAFAAVIFPARAFAIDYSIDKVVINATIAEDGTMTVVERRTFDFDDTANGVYWLLPQGDYEGQQIGIKVRSVGLVENGNVTLFEKSDSGDNHTYQLSMSGSNLRVKVYNRVDHDTVTVQLTYTISNLIVAHSDVAELYWKFVSDGWDVSSKNVTATITLPVPAGQTVDPGVNVRAWGHGTLDGEVSFDGDSVVYTVPKVGSDDYAEARIIFPVDWTTLVPGESDAESSIVDEETAWAEQANAEREAMRRIIAVSTIVLAVIVFGLAALTYLARKRYLKSHVTTFDDDYWRDVPSEDHPAVIACLYSNSSPDSKEFSATLMKLTNEGAISLEVADRGVKTKRKIVIKPDYKIARNKVKSDAIQDPIDLSVMSLLFDVVKPKSKKLAPELVEEEAIYVSDMKRVAKKSPATYSEAIQDFSSTVEAEIESRGFKTDPRSTRRFWPIVACIFEPIACFASFIFLGAVLEAWIPAVILMVASAAACVYSIIVISRNRKISPEAQEIIAKTEALKRWIQDFTNLHEAVPQDVVLWNNILVLAVALGVADKVIEILKVNMPEMFDDPGFAPVYMWYYGADGYGLGPAVDFVQSTYTASAQAVASSSDSSGGGGGGGFSGGGGGGFGGGGGGGAF